MLINRHFGINFYEFINKYRIEEAKKMSVIVKFESKGSSENESESDESLNPEQIIDKQARKILSEGKAESYMKAVESAQENFYTSTEVS